MPSGGNAHQRAMQRTAGKNLARNSTETPIKPEGAILEKEVGRPFTKYLFETIGRTSVLLGGAGLLVGTSFFLSSVLIFFGLGLWIFDPWVETSLKSSPKWQKLLFSSPSLLTLGAFCYWIVFASAAIKITARSFPGDFVDGSKVGKITWKSGYSQLSVIFETPKDKQYTDLDVVLAPGALIADSDVNFPYCAVFNTAGGNQTGHLQVKDENGNSKDISTEGESSIGGLVMTSSGVRLICSKLPPSINFTVNLAVLSLAQAATIGENKGKISPKAEKAQLKEVRIFGSYDSLGGRPNKLDKTYTVYLPGETVIP